MAVIKGFYNTKNNMFLGPMTATNEATGVASTPRHIEGVCFGEYNTDTKEFVPLTNPMVIPKGSVVTYDEDPAAFVQGQFKETVSGIEEDAGADFAKKAIHVVNPPVKKPQKLIQLGKPTQIDLDNLF